MTQQETGVNGGGGIHRLPVGEASEKAGEGYREWGLLFCFVYFFIYGLSDTQ